MAADKVKNIKEKLEFLGCPYVENVDESWLPELLFRPGEPRLRLIQWLLGRFDSGVEDLLESHQARVSNLTDSRVGKLLFCANLLGLCHNDDVDLITGSSSKSKQVAFFEDLIDMICVVDQVDNPPRPVDVLATPNWKGRPKTSRDRFGECCEYLGLLCREANLEDVFKEKIQLFPPDIEKQFANLVVGGGASSKRPRVPDVTHLASMASQITSELQKQTQVLERLQSESPAADNPPNIDTVSRAMSLTMSTLSQMVEGFVHCYETEMKPWAGREKPRLSELGPAFKRVGLLLEKFLKILSSLEKLRMSHVQISRLKTVDMENELAPVGKIALSNLQDCIGILDESVKRKTDILSDADSL